MNTLIKRLELIKIIILLNDEDKKNCLNNQIIKLTALNLESEVHSILNKLANNKFLQATFEIDLYISAKTLIQPDWLTTLCEWGDDNLYNIDLVSWSDDYGEIRRENIEHLTRSMDDDAMNEYEAMTERWSSSDLDHHYATAEEVEVDKYIIPRTIEELAKLKKIWWINYGENLGELPKEIGHLIQLENFSLHGNDLTELPNEIGNLTGLTSLTLSENCISSLPQEIENLVNLTVLDLSHNYFEVIPEELYNLIQLKKLDLSNNQLAELPPNELAELPSKFERLTELTDLDLSGNNFNETFEKEIKSKLYWVKHLHI